MALEAEFAGEVEPASCPPRGAPGVERAEPDERPQGRSARGPGCLCPPGVLRSTTEPRATGNSGQRSVTLDA